MIIFVLASTKSGVIGNNNKLPWNIKEDLEIFKKITINKQILMGRKTFDSLNKKPLPKRFNYILTRNKEINYSNLNSKIIFNWKLIVKKFYKNKNDNIYIIGGSNIFNIFLPYCSVIFINIIKKEYEGNIRINLQKILKNFKIEYKIEHKDFLEYKYVLK